MNNLAQRYNQSLILIFSIAPFIAFLTINLLNMEFNRIMQLLSWIGVIILIIYRNNEKPIKFPLYLIFYFLFILFVFYSDLLRLNREFKIMYLFSNPLIGSFNMMFIIENISMPNQKFNRIFKISKLVILIAFLVILYQQLVDTSFFVYNYKEEEEIIMEVLESEIRLPSIYSWISPMAYGFCFVPIFILIVDDLDKRKRNIFIWVIIGLIYVIFTKGRWALINLLLVFIPLIINHRNKILQFLKYSFVFPLIFGIALLGLKLVDFDMIKLIEERVLEKNKIESGQKTSASTRILAFEAFNRLYFQNPILGVGDIKYGMGGTGKQDYRLRSILKGQSSQIHVGYLSLFYLYGLIGGSLFLGFLFLLIKRLYNSAKIMGRWGPFFGFLGFAMANLTLVTFTVFEMGLLIILMADKYFLQQKTSING